MFSLSICHVTSLIFEQEHFSKDLNEQYGNILSVPFIFELENI